MIHSEISDILTFPHYYVKCKNMAHDDLKFFFTSLIETITKNIQLIDSRNKHQLCAFVLCILFDEGFEAEWLSCRSNVGTKMLINKLKEITRYFEIDLDKDLVRLSLKKRIFNISGYI